MIKKGNSLTVIQLPIDPHQEVLWLGGQAVYRPAGEYAGVRRKRRWRSLPHNYAEKEKK